MSQSDESRRKDRLNNGTRSEIFSAAVPELALLPFHIAWRLLKGTGKVIRSMLDGI